MKILIYGAGVVGCTYGWQLSKAGCDVTVLVRKGQKEFVQKNGISFKMDATEENRKSLLKQVKSGEVRKVLVKQDIPIETDHSLERLIDDLLKSLDELLPFYKETKK